MIKYYISKDRTTPYKKIFPGPEQDNKKIEGKIAIACNL